MEKILLCAPNVSEGRDLQKVERFVEPYRGKKGVKLLDYSVDENHNRCVITAIGEPGPLRDAMLEMISAALPLIDMTKHQGQHPRMGAVDVIPMVPVRNCTMEEVDQVAKAVAEKASAQHGLPFFLFENSASAPHRENLADIRKGQFEGMAEKIKEPLWKPDFGPAQIHPTGGVTAIGAQMPSIAFNINLDTQDIEIANRIARQMRFIGGGFRYVKAIGVNLADRKLVQVSMNLTNYTKTAVYRVFETVKMEAQRYGVNVVGSEVIGIVPMQALVDCAEYYLRIENFRVEQVLEANL